MILVLKNSKNDAYIQVFFEEVKYSLDVSFWPLKFPSSEHSKKL